MRGAAAFLRGFLDSALPLLALLALLSALLRFLPPRASVRAPFFPGEELPSPFPSRHALSSARPVVRPPYRSSSFSPARSSSFTSPVRRPPCAPACHARSPLPTRALRIQALRLVHVTPALPLCLLILSAIPLSVPIPPPPTLPFRPCTTRPCTTCHSMHGGQQEEVGQWEEAQEQSADAATTMLLAALRRLKCEPPAPCAVPCVLCPLHRALCPLSPAPCPLPNASCPMPHAPCPMPHAPCPMRPPSSSSCSFPIRLASPRTHPIPPLPSLSPPPSPCRQRLARGLPGCVLYADDRRLSASSLRAAGSDSFEAHGREFPYWLATKLINRWGVSEQGHTLFTPCLAAPPSSPFCSRMHHRAYAQRHGYRFVEMGEADKEPGRHPSWFKVRCLPCTASQKPWPHMLNSAAIPRRPTLLSLRARPTFVLLPTANAFPMLLKLHPCNPPCVFAHPIPAPSLPASPQVRFLQRQLACCCEWAFFLDSDAYFRMDNHRLSVQSWVDRLTLPVRPGWVCWETHVIPPPDTSPLPCLHQSLHSFLDSDAYFRMDNHRLSVHRWVDRLTLPTPTSEWTATTCPCLCDPRRPARLTLYQSSFSRHLATLHPSRHPKILEPLPLPNSPPFFDLLSPFPLLSPRLPPSLPPLSAHFSHPTPPQHYFDWIARDYNISLANQTWFPRPPSSIFSHSPPACPPSPVGGGQGGGEGEAGEVEHGGWGRGGEGESRAAVCVVAPRNDDEASGMAEGRAGALFNGSMEYVNAGVTLWRRSPHCLKVRCETRSPHCLKVLLLLPAPPFSSLLLLPLGLNPSAQSTQAIEPGTHPHAPPLLSLTHLSLAPLYQPLFFVPTPTPSQLLASWHEEPAKQYLWRRNWEQPRLNVLLAMPQHVADVAVVPFRELTGHSGRAIRHRWLNSIMTDETRSDLEHHQKSARGLAQACPKPPQAWAGRWEGEAGRWKGETGRWDGERGRWEGEMGRWEGETGRWEGEMGSEEGKLCWQEGKMGRREGEMTKTGKDGEAGWGDGSAERENGDSLVTISPATAAASAAASGRAGTEWDRAYVSRPNCCVRGGERGHGGRRTQCGPARRRRDGHQAKGGPAGQHGAAS
ncbi:unnamed protein product [Closterium sp. NIES-54]